VLERVVDEEAEFVSEKERDRAHRVERPIGSAPLRRGAKLRVRTAATPSLIHEVETTAQPRIAPKVVSPMTQ
jgi:hypothetical protein